MDNPTDYVRWQQEQAEKRPEDRTPWRGTTRDYVTLHMGPSNDAPTIDLMKGKHQRIVVFAERADPQPPGLPDGLVAVVLPDNCYIDTSEDNR